MQTINTVLLVTVSTGKCRTDSEIAVKTMRDTVTKLHKKKRQHTFA